MDAPDGKDLIGGLKISWELIQLRLFPKAGLPVTELFRRLADQQINLTGVTLDVTDGLLSGLCLISAEDRFLVERALQPFNGSFEIQTNVGTVTLYPIQGRLGLVRRILSALSRAELPVYGVASSLSSLTITTDYRRLDDAVSAVRRLVELPDNHAPFRPEFRVKQL